MLYLLQSHPLWFQHPKVTITEFATDKGALGNKLTLKIPGAMWQSTLQIPWFFVTRSFCTVFAIFHYYSKYWACQIHCAASNHVHLTIMFMLLLFICQVLQSDFCLQNCWKNSYALIASSCCFMSSLPFFLSFLDFSINSVKSPIIFQSCRKEIRVLAYAILVHVYNIASKNIELKSSA